MDKKQELYGIYVGLMRLHKEFAGKLPYLSERESFIRRINSINSQHNTWFCYMMCEVLRKWFMKSFDGMTNIDIPRYYSDIWHLHKEWIDREKSDAEWINITEEARKLKDVWRLPECEDMILTIVAELEVSDKAINPPSLSSNNPNNK